MRFARSSPGSCSLDTDSGQIIVERIFCILFYYILASPHVFTSQVVVALSSCLGLSWACILKTRCSILRIKKNITKEKNEYTSLCLYFDVLCCLTRCLCSEAYLNNQCSEPMSAYSINGSRMNLNDILMKWKKKKHGLIKIVSVECCPYKVDRCSNTNYCNCWCIWMD